MGGIVFAPKNNTENHRKLQLLTTESKLESESFHAGMSLLAYPNPVRDKFTISLEGIEINATITVLNAMGQEIFRETLLDHQRTLEVNSSQWKNGVYFIRAVNDDNIRHVKVQKLE